MVQLTIMKHYIYKLLSEILGQMYTRGEIAILPLVDISVPDSSFGDYTTNVALKLAKETKKNPKDLAATIVRELLILDTQQQFSAVTEAGGFINIVISQKSLLATLEKIIESRDLYGCSILGSGQIVVVEYFQNNVAKPPHVGHLRSAVVGDALLRIFRSQGYKAISDTHIGDWGTQFGILIHAFKTMGNREAVEKDPINELTKLYVAMSAEIEKNPELHESGKMEFAKLERGDTDNRVLWQWFVDVSVTDFERYRELLQLLPFDHNLGESFYEDKMPAILAELKLKDLVETGETGELYVDLEPYGLGRCILVKTDGATTYHMRDMATYIYRRAQFNFSLNMYVVDNRQSHHFKQLFKVLELAGYPVQSDSAHVDLGFMSLPEGAISTRKGNVISLQNLITEAEKRALAIIDEKNPTLLHKQAIAAQVARAAIKYFDLSHNRKTEFTFTWDAALSFEGNTGPYLQYAHARIHGILRKAGQVSEAVNQSIITSALKSEELDVLRKLQKFPEVVARITKDYMPNGLANYLFELSQAVNSFYQEVPVLQETDEEIKEFRLQLITATAQVIKNGLYLLGIDAPEEM